MISTRVAVCPKLEADKPATGHDLVLERPNPRGAFVYEFGSTSFSQFL
jgi:hypothetical protein